MVAPWANVTSDAVFGSAPGRADEHDLVVDPLLADEAGARGAQEIASARAALDDARQDDEIELAGLERIEQRVLVRLAERDLHAGMARAKLRERPRQVVRAHGRARTDAHRADREPHHLGDRASSLLDRGERRAGARKQRLARGGEGRAAGTAIEELRAHLRPRRWIDAVRPGWVTCAWRAAAVKVRCCATSVKWRRARARRSASITIYDGYHHQNRLD